MNQKVGRNEPCPCGSGKKYKVCCANKPLLKRLHKAIWINAPKSKETTPALATEEPPLHPLIERAFGEALNPQAPFVPIPAEEKEDKDEEPSS